VRTVRLAAEAAVAWHESRSVDDARA
jgi:hypothetical protein